MQPPLLLEAQQAEKQQKRARGHGGHLRPPAIVAACENGQKAAKSHCALNQSDGPQSLRPVRGQAGREHADRPRLRNLVDCDSPGNSGGGTRNRGHSASPIVQPSKKTCRHPNARRGQPSLTVFRQAAPAVSA